MHPALPSSSSGRSSVSSPAVHLEAVLREVLHIGAAIVVIAAAVLHALQRAGKRLQQPSDQIDAERHRRLLREIVEIVFDAGADAVDHLAEIREQPVICRVLVIERRQQQRAATTDIGSLLRQRHGVGECRCAGARHHLCYWNAARRPALAVFRCVRACRCCSPRPWCRARQDCCSRLPAASGNAAAMRSRSTDRSLRIGVSTAAFTPPNSASFIITLSPLAGVWRAAFVRASRRYGSPTGRPCVR